MHAKETPYDWRASEKVLYPTAIQATAALALALSRGTGDRATRAVTACALATALIGFLTPDNRFDALRHIVIATAGNARERNGDGWDGDEPDAAPPEPTVADQHRPEADEDPAAYSAEP